MEASNFFASLAPFNTHHSHVPNATENMQTHSPKFKNTSMPSFPLKI